MKQSALIAALGGILSCLGTMAWSADAVGSAGSDNDTLAASVAPALSNHDGSTRNPLMDREHGAVTARDNSGGSETDDRILQALKADPRTAHLQIAVEGGGGAVTLRGTVSSLAERSAAAEVAAGVSGVSQVDNRIIVKYSPKPAR